MSELPIFYQIFVWSVPALFAITLHEVGHGWVAMMLGDSTAKDMGRLSINPLKHIDPVGTVVVPLIMFFVSGFIFGWAKPVPVNWNQLDNKKRDIALVALAGPFANLIMIVFWAIIAKFFIISAEQGNTIANIFSLMALAGIVINSLLMILNLFPLPPLDGSRVVYSLLPESIASQYTKIEPYGLIILVLLLVSGILFKIIEPFISYIQQVMYLIII
ncbi:MAG: site-2 protease family protein [Legionellales bacterium]|nr:site-2 protease family protein [Legionellales bacterium]|tara:strand:+ start:185 stop:835 length:651 start_codon:yes stop_codon:yes gene_type:complete